MSSMGQVKIEYPGADAERPTDDQLLTLERYLEWYGIDGVLESVAKISGIAIGMRPLTQQEREDHLEHCADCGSEIDHVTGECDCKEVK